MAPKRRRRGRGRGFTWSRLRKFSQGIFLLGFLVLFLGMRQAALAGSLANLFLRLDPLVVLAQLVASHTWLAGSALALLTLGLTLVFGRAPPRT